MNEATTLDPIAVDLLDYWFADSGGDPQRAEKRGELWFMSTAEQDEEMRSRFSVAVDAALDGSLEHWAQTPRGRLALVLLLDQLTRNLNRGTARAFAGDGAALRHTLAALERGETAGMTIPEHVFLMMPLEHAEDLAIQQRCVREFDALHAEAPAAWHGFTDKCLQANAEHLDIIERFGRFPHRNAALGRTTTVAEQAYLDNGAKRFGQ